MKQRSGSGPGEGFLNLRSRSLCQKEGSPFSILFYLASAQSLHLPECSWDGLIQIGDLEGRNGPDSLEEGC